ncbi:peptide transporter family 1-like isoform X2 [Ischnura elegans]|uniref:peptide transporter family 1-like isoform X2 n=1 Tax=Ischnura elegans TaxID=197161 RepID=UPI001ED89584|nr:peptide transporter family 1-like isoform X2 [Ischnura elegans]
MKDLVAVTTPQEKKEIMYPKSVFFIVLNEFCERFSFYGMRTILSLYLRDVLLFTDDTATVIFHTFVMLCYFTPIFGAMIADSFLGKFRTIFYISILYAIGNIVISVGSAPVLEGAAIPVTMIALVMIAAGTGGIKPCVAAFGGEQFTLPEQEKQQKQFFSLFYFAINAGSLITTFVTPVLRQDIQCLGKSTCYPLAFGIPALLMILSVVVFVCGKTSYRIRKPDGNIVLQTFSVIKHAIGQKISNKGVKKDHWLDHASDKYDSTVIEDIKGALKVAWLLLPLPVFWALFDQQGSRWTFQSARMNGRIGSFTLKPDQMQVVNPLLILFFIPIFESILYPLCAKCNFLQKSIPRIFFGGCLAALAFVLSGIVENQLQATNPIVPTPDQGQLRIFNSLQCPIALNASIKDLNGEINIPSLQSWTVQEINLSENPEIKLSLIADSTCLNGQENKLQKELSIPGGMALSYLITSKNNTLSLEGPFAPDNVERSHDGFPKLRVISNLITNSGEFTLKSEQGNIKSLEISGKVNATEYTTISPGVSYKLQYGKAETTIIELNLEPGGVYTVLVIQKADGEFESQLIEITPPNSIHMLWQMPQYIVMTAGEVMFSITGLQFSFTQAPASMKSLMQAMWLLTVAFGNLIVVIIAEAQFVKSQTAEFFLFAGLLLAVMFVFLFMARNYQYVEVQKDDESEVELPETRRSRKEEEANGNVNDAYESPTEGAL